MANVGVIYTARQFVSASALKLYASAVAVVALVQLTWVHRVFENWSQVGLAGTWQYMSYALLHTSLPVQLALALLVVMGAGLVRDLVKPTQTLRHAF